MRQISCTFMLILLICASNISAVQIVVSTWNYENAVTDAWDALQAGLTAVDAAEIGCARCEVDQCRGTVGYGASPDEHGETTLDAMLIDGTTMNIGAVAGLRRIKNAVGVARRVLDNTQHTMLVGDAATEFATSFGFVEEDLSSPESTQEWKDWQQANCQPNFWMNVSPDPTTSCGPYSPLSTKLSATYPRKVAGSDVNHDTIGLVAIDSNQHTAAGTSTNGLNFHIPGRVGDTPIPGAGGYADDTVGAAAATGNGDLFMRFLPSFVAVEEMKRGATPTEAVTTALQRIIEFYPDTFGGVVAANLNGEHGAACVGLEDFPYTVYTESMTEATVITISCLTPPAPKTHRKYVGNIQ